MGISHLETKTIQTSHHQGVAPISLDDVIEWVGLEVQQQQRERDDSLTPDDIDHFRTPTIGEGNVKQIGLSDYRRITPVDV
jgi:hypothetical protein